MHRRNYIPYLAAYANVYGLDSLDKTVETIRMLRRRDTRDLASAHREIRAMIAKRSVSYLEERRKITEYQLSDACRPYRPDNIRRVDLHRLRMINNELSRRANGKRLTAADWSPRFTWPYGRTF